MIPTRVVPMALAALAVLDVSFAGFRAAAGREGRIHKGGYYARAVAVSALAGVGLVAVMAALTAWLVETAPIPDATWSELLRMGERLLIVFGAYAGLVGLALAVYAIATDELRTLASVSILGPFTLVRPWVVVGATAWASALSSSWATYALAWTSSAATLALGGVLEASHRHRTGLPATGARSLPPLQRVLELGRPLVLLVVFVVVEQRAGYWALPLAFVSVFASAIAVHDLIHNALYLPRPLDRWTLALYAQLLIKSGHSLRASHLRHHQLCLRDDDEEGRVVRMGTLRLLLLGPWLTVRQRWTGLRHDPRTRGWQLAETALNLAVFAGLVWMASRGSAAASQYLVAVFGVTVTAPIWGAKIPHALPSQHPVVRWLAARVGRLTPAAASVVLHDLHHRSPRVAVALLGERRAELEARPASPCEGQGARRETAPRE